MNDPLRSVVAVLDVYVLKVRRDPAAPGLLAGVVEAVATGQQSLFRDGAELLAALAWVPATVQPATATITKEGSRD